MPAAVGVEVCDGKDNDCDGLIDEIEAEDSTPMIDVGGPCGTATGICELGTVTCVERGTATARLECVGGVTGQVGDVCDGQDNDCDGLVDEDTYPQVGTDCSTCTTKGTHQCLGGLVCVTESSVSAPETCNGVDDNCNGLIDEDGPGVGQPCGAAYPPCVAGTYACKLSPASGEGALALGTVETLCGRTAESSGPALQLTVAGRQAPAGTTQSPNMSYL